MRKYKKIALLGLLLVVLTGCMSYVDPVTKQVYPESIIRLGDAWTWGKESSVRRYLCMAYCTIT
ncbi:hypothetical protein MGH68_01255 [Erysipelothrix sp. D19-032]